MKQTVNFSTFRDAFRAIRPDNFTSDGLRVLFDDLEQYEEDCGQELELDVIAFCCDFVECTVEEFDRDYQMFESHESLEDLVNDLHEETHVCGTTDTTIIFQSF